MARGQVQVKKASKGGSPGRMRKSKLVKLGLAQKGETFVKANEKKRFLDFFRDPLERDSHATHVPYAEQQKHFEVLARRRADRNAVRTRRIINAMYRSGFGMKAAKAQTRRAA